MAGRNVVDIVIRALDQTKGGLTMPIRNLQDLETAANKLKPALVAMATAAASALAVLVKTQINVADETRKTSKALGTTTEELSAMRYAASILTQDSGKLDIGLRMLSKNMLDFAKGTGEARVAFQALGITTTNNDGTLRSTSNVMMEVADHFSQLQDGSAKTALAMKLFGESGTDLIPMLNEGSAGIRELMVEAESLGLVIGDETATQAEQFNDSLTRMKAALAGIGRQIAAETLPTLAAAAEGTFQWVKQSGALQGVVLTLVDILKGMIFAVRTVYDALASGVEVLGAFAGIIAAVVVNHVEAAIELFKVWGRTTIDIVKSFWELIKTVGEVGTVLGFLVEGDFTGAMDAAVDAVDNAGLEMDKIIQSLGGAFQKTGQIAKDTFEKDVAGAMAVVDNLAARLTKRWANLAEFGVKLFSPPPASGPEKVGIKKGNLQFGSDKADSKALTEEWKMLNDLLKEREKSLQTLRDLQNEFSLDQLDGLAKQLEAENITHQARLERINELMLTESEARALRESEEQAHAARVGRIWEAETQREKQLQMSKLAYTGQILGQLGSMVQQFGKAGFLFERAMAAAQSIIYGHVAEMNIIAQLGVAGIPLGASVKALGYINAAIIAGTAVAGIAHGGMDYVPAESTYRLAAGERVLSPRQNEDLTDFLTGRQGGGSMPNVTVQVDGQSLFKLMWDASRDGRMKISNRAVVK